MFYSFSEEEQNGFRKLAPTGSPDEIADIITFLASPQSRWVNASTVNANNGYVLM
jgi:3-oxoacyl-[acyl-carrier protein] reductase